MRKRDISPNLNLVAVAGFCAAQSLPLLLLAARTKREAAVGGTRKKQSERASERARELGGERDGG